MAPSGYNPGMGSIFVKRRSSHPVLWILLAVAGFIAAFLAIGFSLTPRIVSYDPAGGKRISGFTPMEVQFSTPMDPKCAEAHVQIQPAVPGTMEWAGSTLRFHPASPWPKNSTISIAIQAGACSARGLPLLSGGAFSFQTAGPQILFILSVDGTYHLQTIDTSSGLVTDLLQTSTLIQDYDISPRGQFVVYALGAFDKPSNLWILPLDTLQPAMLLDCGVDACRSPVVSPDGSLVAYERSPVHAAGNASGPGFLPRVETIRMQDAAVTIVSPDGHVANNPRWSPTGWLSFYDAMDRVITVDNLQGGRTFIPDTSGDDWTWSPDARQVVLPEVTLVELGGHTDEQPLKIFSSLFLVTLEDNARRDLSADPQLDDSSPLFSPDGTKLLFTRDFFDDRWTPGRQLWIMDLKDFTAAAITNVPAFSHSSFHWNTDGSKLVFMRFNETAPTDLPAIWLADSNGANARLLVAGGYLPQWLP
jgi:Tol biopolymer transport system component